MKGNVILVCIVWLCLYVGAGGEGKEIAFKHFMYIFQDQFNYSIKVLHYFGTIYCSTSKIQ